jgi:hypothetical protein
MDGIVDTMGLNEVGGKIEIRFGDADRIDWAWECVSEASKACTSEDPDSTSKG